MTTPSLSQYKNFAVRRVVDIPEIRATLTELIHTPTGAEVLHLSAPDDENFFNLSFRTIPETSNGIAHILEHTVLCGSEKFQVKDPFFSMGRRSLNTFMNAFTGADFTCYPASSAVPKDFYNLLEVYLDAVFHPKLTKMSFLQEGHRLEFSKPIDPTSPLTIKGIVYNEMKGALASPETRLNEAIMETLFPDLTYGINSGGNPKDIPKLTHEELIAFHQKFYHPSRCLFFFYGNLPLEGHLDFIEEHTLKNAKNLPNLPSILKQKRFSKKVSRILTYPITMGEEEDNTMIAFAWLTCPILDQEEILALNVIDLVLMGTDASPLKMALLKSNLCKQADSSLEDELSEVPFVLVCKGCSKGDSQEIEKVIMDTFQEICKTGFASDLVEGAIHQLEFSRKEISAPFGLSLYFRSALLKHHGGNPEDGLKIHTLFNKLREKVQDPKYLPSLVQKHFLNNTHFIEIEMNPDPDLEAKEKEEEEIRIKEIENNLNDKQKEEIVKQALELCLHQETQENLDLLPKVTLKDVPKSGKEFFLIEETFKDINVFCHPCFTNDIVYLDLVFDLPKIPQEDLSYLRLFTTLLPQVGAGGRSYEENLDFVFKHTGGLGVDLDLFFQSQDSKAIKPALILRSKAVHRKVDKLFTLVCDTVRSADFTDTERLKELLIQHLEELETSIQNSPLRYAMQLAASSLSPPLYVRNKWYGLDYFYLVKDVLKRFEKDRYFLVEKMKEIQKLTLPFLDCHLVLGCDEAMYAQLKKERFYGLETLKFNPGAPWITPDLKASFENQARVISAPVAFTTEIFSAVPYIDSSSPVLSVASKLMENKTLHKRIREQGGAYGSGAANVPMSGQFYFYAYRDPHIKSSLDAFLEAILNLEKGDFDDTDLEEAKLGILQELDTPVAPGSRAYVAYERLRSKRTAKLRQEYRDRLINTTKDDVKQCASHILLPRIKNGSIVTFSGKNLIETENALMDKKLKVYEI